MAKNLHKIYSKLRNITDRHVRFQSHLSFLQHCRSENVIPTGLSFNKKPPLENTNLEYKWNSTLRKTSDNLLHVLISFYENELCPGLESKTQLLTRKLQSLTDQRTYRRLNTQLRNQVRNTKKKLNNTHQNKLMKLTSATLDKKKSEQQNVSHTVNTTHRSGGNQRRRFNKYVRKHKRNVRLHIARKSAALSDINNIINISGKELTPAATTLLNRGLGFIPTPKSWDKWKFIEDTHSYHRRLRLKEFFHDTENDCENNACDLPKELRIPSKWTPRTGRDQMLDKYCETQMKEVLQYKSDTSSRRDNITKEQRQEIRKLRDEPSIYISKVDKGGSVIIWNRQSYIEVMKEHLSDIKYYQQISEDLTPTVHAKIVEQANKMENNSTISATEAAAICYEHNITTPYMHGLAKWHKIQNPDTSLHRKPPVRAIISQINSPTQRASIWLHHKLMDIVPQYCRELVKDSTDFLHQLHQANSSQISTLPANSLLFSLDTLREDKYLDSINSLITLTLEYGKTKQHFLDISTSIVNGKVETDLYTKPTDSGRYLSPSSHHPRHIFNSIVYSGVIRLRRICSLDMWFDQRASEFKDRLIKSGYQANKIQTIIDEVRKKPRSSFLRYNKKQSMDRVVWVNDFNLCDQTSDN
ncbi:uncharacterized protein [Ptychodera flava]|uniref:uncharacterized protein n=1 Tax=Ptychodera flava TaxID=63121 RepID=UPI003969F376